MSETIYYGVVHSGISFHGPRAIEGAETQSLLHAFAIAAELIATCDGDELEIVRCKYYGDDPNGYWGEDIRFPAIQIDARDAQDWLAELYEKETQLQ
jgi:hypothetical protein